MIVELVRKARFSAAHRLHSNELSDDQNRLLFGKCNHPNGHGHNYVVEVKVRGKLDPKTGIVMDLSELKEILERTVMAKMDHKNLNVDVPELKGINPTAENIAIAIWKMLQLELPRGILAEVLLHETENNVAVYRGE